MSDHAGSTAIVVGGEETPLPPQLVRFGEQAGRQLLVLATENDTDYRMLARVVEANPGVVIDDVGVGLVLAKTHDLRLEESGVAAFARLARSVGTPYRTPFGDFNEDAGIVPVHGRMRRLKDVRDEERDEVLALVRGEKPTEKEEDEPIPYEMVESLQEKVLGEMMEYALGIGRTAEDAAAIMEATANKHFNGDVLAMHRAFMLDEDAVVDLFREARKGFTVPIADEDEEDEIGGEEGTVSLESLADEEGDETDE